MTTACQRCYIGLGSNLDHPRQQIVRAWSALKSCSMDASVVCSSLYQSAPLGPQDQPDFINAVCRIDTDLSPLELLRRMQRIEQQQGRIRRRHWGERTIDLDLLLYGELTLKTSMLMLPHPEMVHRCFVLLPLLEVAGSELKIPGKGRVKALLGRCDCSDVRRIREE